MGGSLQTFTTSYSLKGNEEGTSFAATYSYGTSEGRRAYVLGWILDPELVVVLNNDRTVVQFPKRSENSWYSKLASLGQFRFAGLHLSMGILPGRVISDNRIDHDYTGEWVLDVCYIPNYRGIWAAGGTTGPNILQGAQRAIDSSKNHKRFSSSQQFVPMRWGLATPRAFLDPAHAAGEGNWKQLKSNAVINQTFSSGGVSKFYANNWLDVLDNLSTGVVFIRLDWVTDVLLTEVAGKVFDPPDLELGVTVNYRTRGILKPEVANFTNDPPVPGRYDGSELLYPAPAPEDPAVLIEPLTNMTT